MQQKSKVKPVFKLAEDFLDLRTADTNVIVEQIEENLAKLRLATNLTTLGVGQVMRLRELPLEKRIRRRLAQRH